MQMKQVDGDLNIQNSLLPHNNESLQNINVPTQTSVNGFLPPSTLSYTSLTSCLSQSSPSLSISKIEYPSSNDICLFGSWDCLTNPISLRRSGTNFTITVDELVKQHLVTDRQKYSYILCSFNRSNHENASYKYLLGGTATFVTTLPSAFHTLLENEFIKFDSRLWSNWRLKTPLVLQGTYNLFVFFLILFFYIIGLVLFPFNHPVIIFGLVFVLLRKRIHFLNMQ